MLCIMRICVCSSVFRVFFLKETRTAVTYPRHDRPTFDYFLPSGADLRVAISGLVQSSMIHILFSPLRSRTSGINSNLCIISGNGIDPDQIT